MKSLLKHVLPEPALYWWRRVRGSRIYRGNCASWAEIPLATKSYDDMAVLFRVREAALRAVATAENGVGRYPCWIFSRSRLLSSLGPNYTIQAEWPGFDEVDPSIKYHGFYLQRIYPTPPV